MKKVTLLLRNRRLYLLLYSAMLLSAGAIIWAKYDTAFQYKWWIFSLHSLSLLIVGCIYAYASWEDIRRHARVASKHDLSLLTVLIFTSVFVTFFALQRYPFVSIGDEVRDSGLDAMRIVKGIKENIFEYGNYNGYGLIIPIFSSFFYRLFGNSVLTYRLPASFIALADVLILFILLRKLTNKTAAFFGALALLTFPLHMFFGRTELVVILNSFWTSVMLLLLFITFKKRRLIDYALTGTVLGFAAQFHAAVRVVAIFFLGILILHAIYTAIVAHGHWWKRVRTPLVSILITIVFCIVGFGPLAVYTTKENFFHTKRFSYNANVEAKTLPSWGELQELKDKYLKSLMVWAYEPTNFFYPDQKPLLPPLLAVIFLLGAGYSFFVLRKPFLLIPLFLTFAIPFTNSAITDSVNADHRLNVLLPIAGIFIGIGVMYIQKTIPFRYAQTAILCFIPLYLVINTFSYFKNQPANKNRDAKEYVSMHTMYFLREIIPSNNQQSVCIRLSPTTHSAFSLMHYREQFEYFLPHLSTNLQSDMTLPDTEVHITKGECSATPTIVKKQKHIFCRASSLNYQCPLQYAGVISVYYDEPQKNN